ncbi:hypothetical protein PLUTE_b0202 [Pseudoalteromonas luteoviolacea DSM 6061]|nr:hypothetical protein [Pseudoalteromonas luteoviolacea DSM 6061]
MSLTIRLFLSCLCGSEGFGWCGWRGWCFLSCLCGSEVVDRMPCGTDDFLSCLCGSEVNVLCS